MADDGLKDPFGEMATVAIGMHELLTSLIQAGFTRKEGMELLVSMTGRFVRSQR